MTTPDSQRSIAPRFAHPSGRFTEFPAEDLERSIPQLFMRMARRQPGSVAVEAASGAVTYAELDRASARVAAAIRGRRRPGPEPVAVVLERGAPLMAAALGVLKAGKMLVVLEPSHPAARNATVLRAADPVLVLGDTASAGSAEAAGVDRGRWLDVGEAADGVGADDPGDSVPADALAAIVFTSGTMGVPKGVVHDHRSLLFSVRELVNALRVTPADRLSLVQPVSAILGLRALWLAFLSGATLLPFDVARDGPQRLAAWLRERRITYFNTVPSMFRSLVDALGPEDRLPALRVIRLGGERLTRRDLEQFQARFGAHAALLVTYGASEVSTGAWFLADERTVIEGDIVPVGFGRDGSDVLVLDDEGRSVPPGEVGEIAVRSRYLSRGYWRWPELTARRFVPAPGGGAERMYLTGDLGRVLADNALVHLGRKDAQAKVRGFLVEPAEVEAAILDDPAIREAVAMVRPDARGEGRLVVYVVPREWPGPSIEAIRTHLQAGLPPPLLPSIIAVLEVMPLTPNGKVARNALPEPSSRRPPLATPFVAPRTPIEERLARCWTDVLDLDTIGVNDRFVDLGGSSIGAGRICAWVHATFGHQIPVAVLLDSATVADMAVQVTAALADGASGTVQQFFTELDGPRPPGL